MERREPMERRAEMTPVSEAEPDDARQEQDVSPSDHHPAPKMGYRSFAYRQRSYWLRP